MTRVAGRLSVSDGVWKWVAAAILALSMVLLTSPAFAQLNLGRILGAVTDQSGGAVANAKVTVTDVNRGVSRPLTTDSAGEYNAPSLTPGTYSVRVEAPGFQTVEQQNVLVEVGQDVRVDLTLKPGETSQTVTVTAETLQVNTADAQLGAMVENQVINDLPLQGRLYSKLLDFRPGMQAVPGGKTPTYSTNGGRPQDNEWLFDGLDDVNVYSASGPTVSGNNGFDQITILPVDAIQEINIVENPKAEYGWRPGAQVNVGLKSGTNNVHGTAYAFGRDTDLDAKNPFLGPTLPRATDELEQFGGTVGGPIKKDKLFYFVGYEGKRYTVGSPRTIQVPSSVAGAGASNSFVDAINAMNTAHEPLSPLSLNLAGCTSAGVCKPANGLFNNAGESPTEPVDFNNLGGSDNVIAKIDYHLNDHHSLNADYFYGNGYSVSGSSGDQPYWLTKDLGTPQVARGVWVWTPNSSWVNEARFGWDRYNQPAFAQACIGEVAQPSLSALGLDSGLGNNNLACGPSIGITSFGSLGANSGTLSGGMIILTNQYAVLDTVSYTHGKHQFKFGGEARSLACECAALLSNYAGTVSFGSVAAFSGATALEDFLAGVPATGQVLLGPVERDLATKRVGAFAQDDWRVLPRVLVNLGLRWEYEGAMTERNNLIGNFSPAIGLYQATPQDNHVYNANPHNFAPRLGLAWDVTGKGRTVVRANLGIIDDTSHAYNALDSATGAQLGNIPTGFALYNANGSVVPSPGNINSGNLSLSNGQFPWALNTPIFNATTSGLACGNGLGQVNPLAATSGSNPANPAPCKIVPINQNLKVAYITTWMLDVQQAITNSLTLDVAYVGNHGTDLLGQFDINQPTPGLANGKTSPSNENEQTRRPYFNQYPYLGQILYYSNGLDSNYNALEVSVKKSLASGLSFTGAYTFDHTLDESGSELSNQPMDSALPKLDYADDGPFQHFTLTISYVLPGIKAPGQLLQGWQLNSAINLLGSMPVNADDTTSDISGTGELLDRWTMSGPAKNFQIGGPGPAPCYGQPGVAASGGNGAISAGSFSKASNCVTVAAGTFAAPWANMPAACIAAASAESSNPNVPNTLTNGAYSDATGLESLATFGCYYENGTAIVPPAQGTYGTMGRDVLRARPFREWDFSLIKDWKFREQFGVQFRAEFFNILNSVEYAAPSANPDAPTSFGESSSSPNSTNPIVGNGGPRVVQLGLKLTF